MPLLNPSISATMVVVTIPTTFQENYPFFTVRRLPQIESAKKSNTD